MIDEELFKSEFVREYLRYCQREKSTLTGVFNCDGISYVWGAIVEYGPPPGGGLIIEIWGESNEERGESAHFRFWVARPSRPIKGRAVMRDELTLLSEAPI